MLHRHLAVVLHRAVHLGGPVAVAGPRGAGKTTLLRREFPAHSYASMEDGTDRARARTDPAGFLARFRGPAILDDLHRAPELGSYLADHPEAGPFLIASSRRLSLPHPGFELHPPTEAERQRRLPVSLAMLGRFVPAPAKPLDSFPQWTGTRSFLDHDVRDLIGVHDMDRFERFVAAAQRQSGSILEQQALATECGVSHRTVVRWLGVLDTCFQIVRLPPSSDEYGRRLVRRDKIHFLQGGPFESRVISEIYRNTMHAGEPVELRYWRDSNGLEIPLIVEQEGLPSLPVGIRATTTPREVAQLRRWMDLAGVEKAALIGERDPGSRTGGILRYAWTQL